MRLPSPFTKPIVDGQILNQQEIILKHLTAIAASALIAVAATAASADSVIKPVTGAAASTTPVVTASTQAQPADCRRISQRNDRRCGLGALGTADGLAAALAGLALLALLLNSSSTTTTTSP